MRTKYDWQGLKHEFISGGWLNVSAFLKDKGITSNSYARSKAAGWLEARRRHLETVLERATEQIIGDEAEVRSRQARLARQLQIKGTLGLLLSVCPADSVDHARKLVVDGLREEREALGLGNSHYNRMELNQINVRPPATEFDKLTESMNYEQILEFLAAIKKERARRAKLGEGDSNLTT